MKRYNITVNGTAYDVTVEETAQHLCCKNDIIAVVAEAYASGRR